MLVISREKKTFIELLETKRLLMFKSYFRSKLLFAFIRDVSHLRTAACKMTPHYLLGENKALEKQ